MVNNNQVHLERLDRTTNTRLNVSAFQRLDKALQTEGVLVSYDISLPRAAGPELLILNII